MIAAGQRLFCERSVDAVTVDDIVSLAEVGKGSFYNHFEDREALCRAVTAGIRASVEHAVDLANAGIEDPARSVSRGVCTYYRLALDEPMQAGVLLRVYSGLTSICAPLNRGVVTDVSKGLAMGRFAIPTTEAGVLLVLGVAHMGLARILREPTASLAVAIAQQLCGLLLRGLGVPATEAESLASQASDEIVRLGAYADPSAQLGEARSTHDDGDRELPGPRRPGSRTKRSKPGG